jgi:hypothetical protein
MRRAIGVRDRRGDVEAAHERRPKAKVFERRRKYKCSARRRGRGDFGEHRQNMQLAVEIKLFRFALSVTDAVP